MNPLLILAAVVPALVLLIQVFRADRLEKEPISMLLGLILWGVIAAELASLTERAGLWLLDRSFGVAAEPAQEPLAIPALALSGSNGLTYYALMMFVVVAVSEEGFKYLLLRLRTWHSPEFNCTFDGVVYAVFISLGFALWENVQYVLHYGFATALARAFTAVPGHACFGVFMGTWYGVAKRWDLLGRRARSRCNRVLALLLPVLLHGCYDFIALSEDTQTDWLFLPFIAVLFFVSFGMVRIMSRNDSFMT